MKKKEIKPDPVEAIVKSINKLEIDLGREDLNLLRDKINEIIESK